MRAEHELVLGPLATPADDDLATVASSPAVALLLERAAAAGSPTAVTERDAAALAAICRRLDGIPLALELAAPGLRLLSPSTLLTRLEQTGSARAPVSAPARATCPTGTARWPPCSTGAWTSSSRRRWTSSPGSRCSAAGSRSTTSRPSPATVTASTSCPPSARSSTSHSCCGCRRPTTSRGSGCSSRCGSTRCSASTSPGSATATADRHAAHFHALATAFRDLLQGPGLAAVLDRLDADHANLRSAYLRLLELDRVGDAAELAGSVWLYLALRGHAREGLAWLDRLGAGASDAARCRALTGRLGLLLLTGDIDRLRREADVALGLARGSRTPR